MKGTARLITTTAGRATVSGQVGAIASTIGGLSAIGRASGTVQGGASRTRETNIYKYLSVTPEQPQNLVWLVPQVGIDYHIECNTNWIIK